MCSDVSLAHLTTRCRRAAMPAADTAHSLAAAFARPPSYRMSLLRRLMHWLCRCQVARMRQEQHFVDVYTADARRGAKWVANWPCLMPCFLG